MPKQLKIWHQSMTDLGRLPGYRQVLAAHAARAASPTTSVDLHGLDPATYPDGMAPVEMTAFSWLHHLAFVQIAKNAMTAEANGYDAVAISCFVDPALDLARSLVDIPVVSSCESSLLTATAIGKRFSLITLDRSMVCVLKDLVIRYGFQDRVVSVRCFSPPIDEFELDHAFADPAPLASRFRIEAAKDIAAGADVIIPAEGVLNAMLANAGVRDIDGVPVLDSYGSLLGQAEMLAGLAVGRTGAYARPPRKLIGEMERLTAQILMEGRDNRALAV